MTTVNGTFDITRWDDDTYEDADGIKLGTVVVGKTWHNALTGTSTARLLSPPSSRGMVSGRFFASRSACQARRVPAVVQPAGTLHPSPAIAERDDPWRRSI